MAVPAEMKPVPDQLVPPSEWPASLEIAELGLEPKIDWAGGLREAWEPGEAGARKQLHNFIGEAIAVYSAERDRPSHPGTSRLSPHLHFGEISARQIWKAAKDKPGADAYLWEIGWREFAYHLLFHYPSTTREPLRPEFRDFPWTVDSKNLNAWTKGKTGYPIVDAGMRELWHTGWMHNRVRMVVASFLVKDLLTSWQEGAAWFWDTLVDADLANNTLGWQWCAGCGADAAPYFRVFNPVLQSEKFDPEGTYVRRWIPELARVPTPWVHKPWLAPRAVLAEAGLELGKQYPAPIIDHQLARQRALAAFASLKNPMA
jgi:deoxyribodipyrimidine photo-lyase